MARLHVRSAHELAVELDGGQHFAIHPIWLRERLKGHPWHDACVAFCDWDQASFDPDYAMRPLAYFEPLLRRILSRPAHDPRYVAAES